MEGVVAAVAETPAETAAIGIIMPPPDIKLVVDKTAQFVARNGEAFAKRIMNNERNTTKFGFLQPDNPYHPYYQSKLQEFTDVEKNGGAPGAPTTQAAAAQKAEPQVTSLLDGTLLHSQCLQSVASKLPESTKKIQEQVVFGFLIHFSCFRRSSKNGNLWWNRRQTSSQ